MRKLLAALVTALVATGIGVAGAASAAPPAHRAAQTGFTCSHFQDPTVEYVWSHVCHF